MTLEQRALGWIMETMPGGTRPNPSHFRLWSIVASMEVLNQCASCAVSGAAGECKHQDKPNEIQYTGVEDYLLCL